MSPEALLRKILDMIVECDEDEDGDAWGTLLDVKNLIEENLK